MGHIRPRRARVEINARTDTTLISRAVGEGIVKRVGKEGLIKPSFVQEATKGCGCCYYCPLRPPPLILSPPWSLSLFQLQDFCGNPCFLFWNTAPPQITPTPATRIPTAIVPTKPRLKGGSKVSCGGEGRKGGGGGG